MILLKNGKNSSFEDIEILIKDDKIFKIGSDNINKFLETYSGDVEIIDACQNVIMPAFVDPHFHLRNPGQDYKQTYDEAVKALMKGGYSDFIGMANTNPPCDSIEILDEIKSNMEKYPVRNHQLCTVTKAMEGKELVDFKTLSERTKYFSDDGKNIDDYELFKEALLQSKKYGFTITDHSHPEIEMVKRNIELVKETGGNLHICHVSKKEAIESLMAAKDAGVKISFELTPHHLFGEDLDYRVNPSIANHQDRLAMIEALKSGYVNCIGTDHAPHTKEDKENSAPGISNIEFAFSMIYKVFDEFGLPLSTLEKLMCQMPGKMIKKDSRLAEGLAADIVIVSTEDTKLDLQNSVLRSKNSPFDNWDTKGKVIKTIIAGQVVYSV